MQKTENILRNSKVKDSSSKIIFEDNILCSQFLRDYVDLEPFKHVTPEDIEDVSAQYVPLFEEERNADRVKKVRTKNGESYFLVSLIEHKTEVDYNVVMQIFRYMVCIWTDYEKEMEKKHKGISRQQSFTYPPVIPIVYYEGKAKWTASRNFKNRITNGEHLGSYVPNFMYYLVPVHQYSNERLLENADEISLIMMINKLQSKADVEAFKKLPPERMNAILSDTPDYLRELIADIFKVFLLKVNVPAEEAVEMADKVKEKRMGELFANMDKMNLNVELERKEREEAERRAEEAARRVEEVERRAAEMEKRMGELFANMDKLNLNFEMERKKKEEAEKRAEEAERRVAEIEKRMEELKKLT